VAGGNEAKRAFDAMMEMRKIDIAAIEAARLRGSNSSWMSRRECDPVLGSFLLLHFGHFIFAASCSVMVSVRSNDLPHRSYRLRALVPNVLRITKAFGPPS
jgi:hypothetical protein